MPIKLPSTGTVEERLRRLEQAINFADAVQLVSAMGTEGGTGAGTDYPWVAGLFAPGVSETVPTGAFALFADTLIFTGTQVLTVQGTGVVRGV